MFHLLNNLGEEDLDHLLKEIYLLKKINRVNNFELSLLDLHCAMCLAITKNKKICRYICCNNCRFSKNQDYSTKDLKYLLKNRRNITRFFLKGSVDNDYLDN